MGEFRVAVIAHPGRMIEARLHQSEALASATTAVDATAGTTVVTPLDHREPHAALHAVIGLVIGNPCVRDGNRCVGVPTGHVSDRLALETLHHIRHELIHLLLVAELSVNVAAPCSRRIKESTHKEREREREKQIGGEIYSKEEATHNTHKSMSQQESTHTHTHSATLRLDPQENLPA
jgi:hypothetical protein